MTNCEHKIPIETRCPRCWTAYLAGLRAKARAAVLAEQAPQDMETER